MKLSEFIVLTPEEKRFTVLQKDLPIAKRQVFEYMVFLFQVQNYYVEAYCCHERKEIREYRLFYNLDHLTPYLDVIKIANLLN